MDKMGDILSEKTRENIIKTIENTSYSHPHRRKKLISYIKPILYNNKDIVIRTKKMLENFEQNDEDIDLNVFKKGTKIKDIKKMYKEKFLGKK
jgi:hypothetical protein